MIDITIDQLTQKIVDGNGTFDTIMSSMNAHIDGQFKKDRIKGTEYATVYLGMIEAALQHGLGFLLQQQKIKLEAEILEQQVLLAKEQVLLAKEQILLAKEQIPKIKAETALLEQQALNAVKEGEVLDQQVCKLKAEFDLLQTNNLKSQAEIELLKQKLATEKAQVTAMGVDPDSVIGRQKALYFAQTAGFEADKIQKVAKTMIDSWNVRRTTDEGTVADNINKLADANVGRAVEKMLSNAGA